MDNKPDQQHHEKKQDMLHEELLGKFNIFNGIEQDFMKIFGDETSTIYSAGSVHPVSDSNLNGLNVTGEIK